MASLKIKHLTEPKIFTPFTMIITVDSPEEARLWYHIFNRGRLRDAIASGSYDAAVLGNEQIAAELPDSYVILDEELKRQGINPI